MNKVGISLGWNCNGTVHGVVTGIRSSKNNGYLTCPFDEMVSNLSGIVKCIEDDFKFFCDTNYLKFKEVKSVYDETKYENLIQNTYYKFLYNHESPGHANLHVTQKWKGGINHYIDNKYYYFIERYERRIQNFKNYLNDSNNYITFILHGYDKNCESITKLDNVIKNKYPNLKYEFYFLDVDYDKTVIYDNYKNMGYEDDCPELDEIVK
jgi:hypothetical protein